MVDSRYKKFISKYIRSFESGMVIQASMPTFNIIVSVDAAMEDTPLVRRPNGRIQSSCLDILH